MTLRNFLLVAVLALGIAGCAVVSKVDTGRVTIDGIYTVQSPIEWASIEFSGTHKWTVDGPRLQELRFVTAVEDGEAIFVGRDADKMPKFDDSMNELEIVEFFQASAAALGLQSLQTADIRHSTFGEKPGFRFEFTYLTKEGLAMSGIANGAVIDKELYIIIYAGTREHYFDKHRQDAETVMDSVKFL